MFCNLWFVALLTAVLTQMPIYAWANALCVTSAKANLRSGPGASFKVSWTVGKYMPLKQTGAKGSWVKVQDLDGAEHWVSGSNVSGRIQCVVVRAKYAALRSKPDSRAPTSEISLADRYTPFKKVMREDGWLLVEDDFKEQYWISDTQVWWPVKRSSVAF